MKDFDLASKIKAIRPPEQDDQYWEKFPERVLAELRTPTVTQAARRPLLSVFWWASRVTVVCLVLTFCLWQSRMPQWLSHTVLKDKKQLCLSVMRFHDNVDRLMQDEHGLHKLVTDQP